MLVITLSGPGACGKTMLSHELERIMATPEWRNRRVEIIYPTDYEGDTLENKINQIRGTGDVDVLIVDGCEI